MKKTEERASKAVLSHDHHVALIRASSYEDNQVRVYNCHQGGHFPLELFDWVFAWLFLDLKPQLFYCDIHFFVAAFVDFCWGTRAYYFVKQKLT